MLKSDAKVFVMLTSRTPKNAMYFLDISSLKEANYELSARHASTARPTLEQVSLISGREPEATNLPSF
jgi:hypothetical protein